jgi:hypothetical protein
LGKCGQEPSPSHALVVVVGRIEVVDLEDYSPPVLVAWCNYGLVGWPDGTGT